MPARRRIPRRRISRAQRARILARSAARYRARRFRERRDFWPATVFGHQLTPSSIQGAHRWNSYNWYLRQLHGGRSEL